MEGKIRVTIVSNNRLLRESITHVLTNRKEFEVVAGQGDPSDDGTGARPAPDVWLSDSLQCFLERVPHFQGDENASEVRCVLVAMPDDAKQFLTAVSHGVLGYVLQEASAADVVAAVRAVANGDAVCTATLARVLFRYVASQRNELPNARGRKRFNLTRREQQLVPLVSRGLTNKEIAVELSVSEQTVKSHIHRILRKVGVEDRFALSAACRVDQIGT